MNVNVCMYIHEMKVDALISAHLLSHLNLSPFIKSHSDDEVEK